MKRSLAVVEPEAAGVDGYLIDGWDSRAPRAGMSDATRGRARLMAEAIFSDDSGAPPRERLDWALDDLSDFLGHVSARARFLFWLLTFVVCTVGPLLAGRFARFRSLSLEERVAVLERVERSPLSLVLLGAKTLLSIVYYEHADARAAIGWDAGGLGSDSPLREEEE